jgi:uncharacterized protein (DUF427 family)
MARRPAADAGITVAPNPNRVIVRVGGAIVADTMRALVMRAPGTPDQQYIPRDDVDMTRLVRTDLITHCPYKGDASYWSIQNGPRSVENAVWSYETPHDDMAPISGYLAFYTDRVDAIEERPVDASR